MDIAASLRDAVENDGLRDLTVRVAEYASDGVTPLTWQAIAKYQGRLKGPWGVAIRSDEGAAIVAALNNGTRPNTCVVPSAQEDIFS